MGRLFFLGGGGVASVFGGLSTQGGGGRAAR